ncbi:MAG: flagellar protein FlgN [Planctomycetes bacterium]|nr:flagellar protein FlgN [Planctomycetota bacterium]
MEVTLTASDLEFKNLIEQLIDVLKLHIKHHRGLLEIMDRKKKAMISMKREELEKILDLEREVIGAVGVVEEERIHLTAAISKALGSPKGGAMRLAELIQHVGEDYREELLDLREEMRDIADAMDCLNQINRTLAMHSLDHLHLYIAMLSGVDPEAKTYGKEGALKENKPSFLMDRRI